MHEDDLRKLIDLQHMIECPDCEGTGIFHYEEGESWTCQECEGEGKIDPRATYI